MQDDNISLKIKNKIKPSFYYLFYKSYVLFNYYNVQN